VRKKEKNNFANFKKLTIFARNLQKIPINDAYERVFSK
jgi:hypothetical protein